MRNCRVQYIYKVWLIALLFLGVGCDVEYETQENLGYNEVEHTLVMYLMADNNLAANIYQNAIDAELGMMNASPASRLLVYLDTATKTKLYEIRYLPYGAGDEHIKICKVLKEYPSQLSSTPEVMSQVMSDIVRLAPSRSYGLVLSGHGTGWFPRPSAGTSYDEQRVAPRPGYFEYDFSPHMFSPLTRYMGWDYLRDEGGRVIVDDSYTDSSDLLKGLAPIHFDYIIFDACFMASTEFLYDMRNVADYIIASPVEILAVGLPYREIVANLVNPTHNVSKIADIALDVYMRDDDFSQKKSLALTVVDCSKLEALAEVVAEIYASTATQGAELTDVIASNVDMSCVQVLDRMRPAGFYDLEDFVCELTDDEILLNKYHHVMDELIVNKVQTEDIFSLGYSPDMSLDSYGYEFIETKVGGSLDLSGLSVYVPREETPITLSHYLNTSWARKIYGLDAK